MTDPDETPRNPITGKPMTPDEADRLFDAIWRWPEESEPESEPGSEEQDSQ